MTDQYFATLPDDQLAAELREKIKDYYYACDATGRTALWNKAIRLYYGLDGDGGWAKSSAVTYGGDQGELVKLRVNHFRAFIQHVHTLVAGERPAVQTRAGNNSHEAAEKATFARYLLDQFYRAGVEDGMRQAALYSLYQQEGWLMVNWDRFKGVPHTADESGQVVYTGDLVTIPLRPCDVIRDTTFFPQGDDTHPWLITRRKVSRWEAMARYPQFAEHIRDTDTKTDGSWDRMASKERELSAKGNDWVYQYEFFHRRDLVLPAGKWVTLIGDKVVDNQDLPCAQIPVLNIQPDHEEDTPFGFSGMMDLMGPQQAYDSFISVMLSAHDATSIPNFWTQRGDDLDVEDLRGQLKLLQSDVKPEVIQLTAISEHTYKLEQLFQGVFENLTGINSTVRGNPPANLESGSALALLDAKAVQFQSGFQGAWVRLVEKSGKHILDLLRRHVTVERAASISAEHGVTVAKYWTGEDLDGVDDVVVESANPAMNTVQGRMSLADKWAELGWIKTPDQYAQVVVSGRYEPVYKREHDETRLIREENKAILSGQTVPVLPTDRHSVHVNEHAAELFSNVSMRQDNALMEVAIAHVKEHIDFLRQGDPLTLAIVGDPLAQVVAQLNPVVPPAPGGKQNLSPQEGQPPEPPKMPEMPTNPQTGEQAPHPKGVVQ